MRDLPCLSLSRRTRGAVISDSKRFFSSVALFQQLVFLQKPLLISIERMELQHSPLPAVRPLDVTTWSYFTYFITLPSCFAALLFDMKLKGERLQPGACQLPNDSCNARATLEGSIHVSVLSLYDKTYF